MQEILDIFGRLSSIPRCSKQEAAIRQFLLAWAESHGFAARTDQAGNLLIRVPAGPGQQAAPPLVLQAHMDMVCEKSPASGHDFASDPIELRIEGDWLSANQTTLGADNGAGLALAMALAEDATSVRPALELLVTVDEESGLTGASRLDPELFSGQTLINLDSEEEGVFTIGCAGGRDLELVLPVGYTPVKSGRPVYELKVHGLQGGHSGINIGAQRANANVLLSRLLGRMAGRFACQLAAIDGGTRHNAIPRDAHAYLFIEAADESPRQFIREQEAEFRGEYPQEQQLAISWLRSDREMARVMNHHSAATLRHLLLSLPDGVQAMAKEAGGLVETSVNFATIREQAGAVHLLLSQRSSRAASLEWLSEKLGALATLAGASVRPVSGYPGWQPDPESELLKRASSTFARLYGKAPVIEVIHAGLECGLIGAKKPGLDMISIGPTICNPHSPAEKLFIPSLAKVYTFTKALLESYGV